MTSYLVVVLSIVWGPCDAQAAEIRMVRWSQRDYYPWIVFLTEGPIAWRSAPPKEAGQEPIASGRAFRVVQLVSEIYDTVLVEEVALGNEGCCKKVARVSRLDLDGFAKAFGFTGELSGFRFVDWLSDTSFRFILNRPGFPGELIA